MAQRRDHSRCHEEWKSLYVGGMSTPAIAKRFGVSTSTVGGALKRLGVPTRPSPQQRNLELAAFRNEWAAMYRAGKTAGYIADRYDTTPVVVARHLRAIGVQMRTKDIATRRYTLANEEVFSKIDTEGSAYWLGFLMADGTVDARAERERSRSFRITLGLAERDRQHLERFRAFVGTEKPIYVAHHKRPGQKESYSTMLYLNLSSKSMTQDLIRWGCTPAKTHTLQYPGDLPESLARHFVRGYFDGDGCISGRFKPWFRVRAQWTCGSKPFLEAVQAHLTENAGVQRCAIAQQTDHRCFVLRCENPPDVERIYHWFYRDATVYLDRKKATFDRFLGITAEAAD